MKKNAITFPQLAARLERAIHCDVGLHGLNILIYGWRKKYRMVSHDTIRQRKCLDGVEWLSLQEAQSFSKYAGYDLTQN